MTTSESKGRFFYKTNRIDSNRELECSSPRRKVYETPIRTGQMNFYLFPYLLLIPSSIHGYGLILPKC